MSYNNLVNTLTNTNKIIHKGQNENKEPKTILTREEKMDAFLETTVVDKYKQKWKDLTTFLKTNRIKMFINSHENLTNLERESTIRKVNNMLTTGKLKNADFDYDSDEGVIKSIKGLVIDSIRVYPSSSESKSSPSAIFCLISLINFFFSLLLRFFLRLIFTSLPVESTISSTCVNSTSCFAAFSIHSISPSVLSKPFSRTHLSGHNCLQNASLCVIIIIPPS